MPFLFVDRVVELSKDKRILAARQCSLSDDVFQYHFPGRPIVPASSLIESAAQAATILLESSSAFLKKAFVGYVADAKFRHEVVPGYEILVELTVENMAEDAALLRGDIRQRDRRCASIRLGMVLCPLGDFFRPEHMTGYKNVYRTWLQGSLLQGFDQHPLDEIHDEFS